MTSIHQTLVPEHHRCDRLLADAETEVARDGWAAARRGFAAFRGASERHFHVEEEVLFPAFEDRTGSPQGPTRIMRLEHAQMRALLDEMAGHLANQDRDAYLGLSETLLTLMQQHNIKEEQVLYPLADQALADRRDELIARMQALETPPV